MSKYKNLDLFSIIKNTQINPIHVISHLLYLNLRMDQPRLI